MRAHPGNMPSGHSSTLQTESSTQDRQPQPSNYEPLRPRQGPRRATQACLLCRQRRVRCDVSLKEGDCTNCVLDEQECIVVSSKRRARRTPNEKTPASSSSNQSRMGNESPQGLRQNQGTLQTSRVRRENDLVIRYTERTTFLDNSQTSQSYRSSEVRLPEYIKPLDVQRSEELELLRQRAVFDLLPLDLAQIVLSRYEELVYPVLPIIDIAEFRSAISGRSGSEIPLLLYHAVMVMGLNCTESQTVLQLSHTTKGELRSASYDKAKTLFDTGVEHDRIVLCQASLLLADRDFYTDVHDGSYWVGNAILHANFLGLYRAAQADPGRRNTRKILWWCVVIKECDISTYVNYPPRVSPFASPIPVLRDFGVERDINMDSYEKENLLDTPAAKLASIYILRAKRCCQVYLVKRQMYDEIQPWNGQQTSSTLRALRRDMLSQIHSWESDAPSELRIETLQHEFDSSVVGLTCASAAAEIIYWSVQFFLYMPDLRFHIQANKRIETVVDPEGRPLLRQAAGQIAAVLEALLALNMGQSLTASHGWHTAVTAFVLLQDTRSLDPVIRENALRNLEVCHRAAHALSETYPLLSQVTLGFQPADWQPHELQPRTGTGSPASNPPTYADNEHGPRWEPKDQAPEQTYAVNSRLSNRYTEKDECQVGDVLGWVSLG